MTNPTLRAFGDLVFELNDLSLSDEGLFERLITSCQKFIPNSSLWVTCSDLARQKITCLFGPFEGQAVPLMPMFNRHVQEHPQFMAMCHGNNAPVDAVSDYVSLSRWRSTGMFTEVLKQVGAVDQMSASRRMNGQMVFSMVLNRNDWGFDEHERTLLALLTPHVMQAWRTRMLLRELERVQVDDKSKMHLRFLMMIDGLGNVLEAQDGDLHWLRKHFGHAQGESSSTLPKVIRNWLHRQLTALQEGTYNRPDDALEHYFDKGDGTRLCVKLLPGRSYGVHVLVFSRVLSHVTSAATRLMEMGLAKRQAEVLYWVTEGKTNEEIAGILECSVHTVKTHLRSVFSILMVENRHAAASLAWQFLHAGEHVTHGEDQ